VLSGGVERLGADSGAAVDLLARGIRRARALEVVGCADRVVASTRSV
jgi:hypothetical protein